MFPFSAFIYPWVYGRTVPTESVKVAFIVRRIFGAIFLLLGSNLQLQVNAAKPAAVPSPDLVGWKSTVQPFLSSHCISCHGSEKQKGGLNLEEYDGDILDLTKAGIWHEIVDVLNVCCCLVPNRFRLCF